MKLGSDPFEDRLNRIEDTTGAHRELSDRYPLLATVKPPQLECSVIKSLSEQGRGFLRRKVSLRNRSNR
ncbi:MAG: hypothetical protein AAGG79_07235 [Pseudomonadota bacterium]